MIPVAGRNQLREIDRSCLERWKKGDKKAFEEIVRTLASDAFLIALAFVGNEEDARDLSQDAFIKAYQARERFDASKPFRPWFYSILRNHCINFLNRSCRSGEGLFWGGRTDRERFASSQPGPAERLEREERRKMLMAAVERLSFEHREIIVLKNFKGYSYREIAEILGIPIGTVMSRLYYARKMLKRLIEEFEEKGIPQEGGLLAEGDRSTGEMV